MKKILFAHSCILFSALFAIGADIITQPGKLHFLTIEREAIPINGQEEQIEFDLPKGMKLRPDCFLSWHFISGSTSIIPAVAGETVITREDKTYTRYQLLNRFQGQRGISLIPGKQYSLRLKLRYEFKQGNATLLLRFSNDNGGMVFYQQMDSYSGNQDWVERNYEFTAGKDSQRVCIFIHKVADADAEGFVDVSRLRLFEEKQEISLARHDFSPGSQGWMGPCTIVNTPNGPGIQLKFHGKTVRSMVFYDYGPIHSGAYRFTLPFETGNLPDGEYSIFVSRKGNNQNGQPEKFTLEVKRKDSFETRRLEIAMWLAESPYAGQPQQVREAILSLAKASGFNTMYVEAPNPCNIYKYGSDIKRMILPNGLVDHLAGQGFQVFAYLPFEMNFWGQLNTDYLNAHPEAQSFDWKNRPARRICPTYLMSDRSDYWRIFEDIVTRMFQESRLNGVYWDVETLLPVPSPQMIDSSNLKADAGSACFCQKCIERFKKEYGITDFSKGPQFAYRLPYNFNLIPEPAKSILMNHPLEWAHFVLKQTVWQTERLRKAAKTIREDAQMRIYTGMYSRGYWRYPDGGLLRWSEFCGVDWERIMKVCDAVMGCHNLDYYPEEEALLLKELFRESAARKMPVILDISTQDLEGKRFKNFYSRIMYIFAACEADGFGLWGYWELDSRDYTEIGRAMENVTRVERFLSEGRRLDSCHKILPCNSTIQATTRILGKKRAVFIFNRSAKNAKATLINLGVQPAASVRFKAVDLQGKIYPDPEHIELSMAPDETRVILIEENSFRHRK